MTSKRFILKCGQWLFFGLAFLSLLAWFWFALWIYDSHTRTTGNADFSYEPAALYLTIPAILPIIMFVVGIKIFRYRRRLRR
jgi:hypothetical protein